MPRPKRRDVRNRNLGLEEIERLQREEEEEEFSSTEQEDEPPLGKRQRRSRTRRRSRQRTIGLSKTNLVEEDFDVFYMEAL